MIYSENIVFRLRHVQAIRRKGGVSFELQIPFMEIHRGQFIAIVGPSGCGKSTLVDMLGLVLKPTKFDEFALNFESESGKLFDLSSLSQRMLANTRRTSIGYILQAGGLIPFLTVKENIFLPCRLNHMTKQKAKVLELAKHLGIYDQLSKKPQYLSGGQRQRVAIARALAHQPPIVLADEPTAAVDNLTAGDIIAKFRELVQRTNITVVLVTHDESLAIQYADRIYSFSIHREKENHVCSILVDGGGA